MPSCQQLCALSSTLLAPWHLFCALSVAGSRISAVCSFLGSYFLCLGHAQGSQPPVFFYFGNEDHVELYIEHTGIMWETAPAMGAALIFLEHRYYGQSLPFPPGTPGPEPLCLLCQETAVYGKTALKRQIALGRTTDD